MMNIVNREAKSGEKKKEGKLFSCSYWVFNLNNSIIDDNAMSPVFRRLYSVLCVQLVQEY